MDCFADNSKYNVLTKNCTQATINAWNKAAPKGRKIKTVTAPLSLKVIISLTKGSRVGTSLEESGLGKPTDTTGIFYVSKKKQLVSAYGKYLESSGTGFFVVAYTGGKTPILLTDLSPSMYNSSYASSCGICCFNGSRVIKKRSIVAQSGTPLYYIRNFGLFCFLHTTGVGDELHRMISGKYTLDVYYYKFGSVGIIGSPCKSPFHLLNIYHRKHIIVRCSLRSSDEEIM